MIVGFRVCICFEGKVAYLRQAEEREEGAAAPVQRVCREWRGKGALIKGRGEAERGREGAPSSTENDGFRHQQESPSINFA
jgi:hypothetical protein